MTSVSYPTWAAFKASRYFSMTEKQFTMLLKKDRDGAIRVVATEIAQGLNTEGLIALIVSLHLRDDENLDETDDEDIVDIARQQCLIQEYGVGKFCDEPVGIDYHLHQGGLVGNDCCWDDQLKSTE